MMRQLAVDGAKDPAVRDVAIRTLRRAMVRPRDTRGELAALFAFVRDRVRFTGDVYGVETLQSPRRTLEWMAGDCDDRAVLLVSLARSVGIAADLTFKAVAVNPARPGTYSHVYVVARADGETIPLDPTFSDTPLGWEIPSPYRAEEAPA